MERRIHESAYKHGIGAADMLHAMTHDEMIEAIDDDKHLYLGWSADGAMLEVISYLPRHDLEVVVHAMPIRRRYLSRLPEPGADDE